MPPAIFFWKDVRCGRRGYLHYCGMKQVPGWNPAHQVLSQWMLTNESDASHGLVDKWARVRFFFFKYTHAHVCTHALVKHIRAHALIPTNTFTQQLPHSHGAVICIKAPSLYAHLAETDVLLPLPPSDVTYSATSENPFILSLSKDGFIYPLPKKTKFTLYDTIDYWSVWGWYCWYW